MIPALLVTKSSGRTEPFSIQKLRRSLGRAQAAPDEIDEILAVLSPRLYQGISTKKIYSEAFRLLRRHSRPTAARYHLKNGIMELGPSGFPFEKFVAKLFEHKNYLVATGQIIPGQCVSHEVDVVAKKSDELILMECKYRNTSGLGVDVKTPLYVNSRFEDIREGKSLKNNESFEGWLVTNSRFTRDARDYGRCRGIHLMSWNYPSGNSLRDIIDQSGLYPLTCLTSLTKQEKKRLLESGLVLVSDVYRNQDVLASAGVNSRRMEAVFSEGEKLCENAARQKSNLTAQKKATDINQT
jgi:hypothetical protein